MKPPLVALTWMDAHGTATNTYELHELPHKALEIVTYGLLLREDEAGVSIAAEDCGGGCFRGVTFVPAALVKSIKPLSRRKRDTGAGRASERDQKPGVRPDGREVPERPSRARRGSVEEVGIAGDAEGRGGGL